MSVGPGGDLDTLKSLPETFSGKIGAEPGQSRSLCKIPWSLGGVNFSTWDDKWSRSSGISTFSDIREGIDFETDIRYCEITPELALTFSESSRGLAKELGSFFSLSWVKGPSS